MATIQFNHLNSTTLKLKITLSIFVVLFAFQSYATHVLGGNFVVTQTGANTFEIKIWLSGELVLEEPKRTVIMLGIDTHVREIYNIVAILRIWKLCLRSCGFI